jgi:hypothetical protein
MRYEDIEAPIRAKATGEAFEIAYVAKRRSVRQWLCGWDGGPRWSEDRSDAIWVSPKAARAVRDHFGHYLKGFGSIRLVDREASHERLKDIVGRDYWKHIT